MLGIFAERELDAGQRAFERELRGGLAPAELDDDGLAADGIGAAVQNVGDGDAAREIAIDVDVVGIENVGDVGDRRDGDAAFVDAAVDGDVRVAIDDAGHDELARGVDHLRVFRRFDGGADFGDFAILNKDGAVLDGAVRNGEDGGVLNQDDRRRIGRSGGRVRRGSAKKLHSAQAMAIRERLLTSIRWNSHSAPPATDESSLVRR